MAWCDVPIGCSSVLDLGSWGCRSLQSPSQESGWTGPERPTCVARRVPGHHRRVRAVGVELPAGLPQRQRAAQARRAGHADAGRSGRAPPIRAHHRAAPRLRRGSGLGDEQGRHRACIAPGAGAHRRGGQRGLDAAEPATLGARASDRPSVLDIDASITPLHGRQGGAENDDNPSKPASRPHHGARPKRCSTWGIAWRMCIDTPSAAMWLLSRPRISCDSGRKTASSKRACAW